MTEPAMALDGDALSEAEIDAAIELAGGERLAIRQLLDDCRRLQQELATTRLNVSAGWARGRHRRAGVEL